MADEPAKAVAARSELAAIDSLCDEFERAWRAGESPTLESFLSRMHDSASNAAFVELLRLERELRHRRGDDVRAEEYLKRFPEFEREIRGAFSLSDVTLDTGGQSDPAADTVAHVSATSQGELRVRCPQCRSAVSIAPDAQLEQISCGSCGSSFSLVARDDDAEQGAFVEIAHFKLIERLGMGAFGTVWKALDAQLDRTVALKIPRAGQLDRQRQELFLREARSAAQLRHPHIVPVYEVGREGETLYIVSEFVRGTTLAERLAAGPIAPRDAAQLAATIASALEHAHQRGIVHRDLKPANVMIDDAGQPHLMDFGLARRDAGETTMTLDGQMLGTPAYMSPEQAKGESHLADRRSDVYSLGVMMFEMLAGQLPFVGNAHSLIRQVINDEPPLPRRLRSGVPRDLETICLKCLAKEKERRYQSAAALEQDLKRFLNDEPIEARPVGLTYKLWRKARRNPAAAAAAAITVVAILGGAAFYAKSRRTASDLAIASQSAEGTRQALNRLQDAKGIKQLAVLSFRNLTSKAEDDWLSAGFASVLETKLSDVPQLKVVGKATIADAGAALGFPVDKPLDDAAARRLGEHLVVNHVLVGEFQRLGDQIQVSARIVNVATGAIDQGGIRVAGRFPDDVFTLQSDLAGQCLARLGVVALGAVAVEDQPAVTAPPAASVEAWVLLGKGQHALENREYDAAIRLLTQAVEADPHLAKAYRALGQAYAQSERTEDAVAAFKRAIELDETDFVSLTYFNLLSGRIAEGLDAMDRAAQAGFADLDVLKLSAPLRISAAIDAGKDAITGLLDDLQQAIEKHPDDDELWILVGQCYAALDQDERALEALEKAVEVKPESFLARLYLAVEYDEAGRKDDADKQFAEAERLRPEGAAGYREFGEIYLKDGEPDRAIKELTRALELEPDNSATHTLIAQAYANKLDLPNALSHLESALATEPNSSFLLSGLCRLTNLMQDNARLIKYARQWADVDPDSYEAHQYLRIAFLKTGQRQFADDEAKRLAGLTPTHASFFFWTGNALIQGSAQFPGLLEEAVTVLAKGHAEFPDNKLIYSSLRLSEGMKLVKERQWGRAIYAFKQSAAAAPRINNIQLDCALYQALCYMELGQFTNAAEAAHRFVDTPQLAPFAMQMFNRGKRYDYAASLVEKQLKSAPQDQGLQEALVNLYAVLGRWDELESFIDNLPAATDVQCHRRLHLGGMYADRMEYFHRFDAAQKQQYLEALVAQSRELAAKSDAVNKSYLDALERWLYSSQPWLVALPFPGEGGLDQPLPPETAIDPDAIYDGAAGAKVRWQVHAVRPGLSVDLKRLYDGSDQVVGYAVTYIHCPEEQSLRLRFDGRDFVKAWLGDDVIVDKRLGGPSTFVDVKLAEGANRLLIKTVDQPVLDWPFEVSALDEQGWPAAVTWSCDADPGLGAARAAAHRMRDLVGLRDETLTRLRNDATLSDDLRAAALTIAEGFADDPAKLNQSSWRFVQFDRLDAPLYRLAVEQADAAVQAEPENWTYLATLGVAQHRAGRHIEAIKTLADAEGLCRADTGAAAPAQLAVAALAHHALGHAREARDLYIRARDLFRGSAFAGDAEAYAFLREADRLLKEPGAVDQDEDAEINAVKEAFVAADQAGWLHDDLQSYMAWWADDVEVSGGRGETVQPNDPRMDRDALQLSRSLLFQELPSQGIKFAYDDLQVQLDGDQGQLKTRTVVQFPGGYETWDGAYSLRRTRNGWRAAKHRGWIVNRKLGEGFTEFNAETCRQLDDKVEAIRAGGDRRQLAQALADARRYAEAHQVARQVTETPGATPADWILRAQLALRADNPADALVAYKRVLELDPSANIPPFQELAVPAPPTLELAGVDLPADREGTVKSVSADAEAEFVVQNRTPYLLDFYWLNYQGQREHWRRLLPGATWANTTFQTHPWLITDAGGRALGILEMNQPARTFELAEKSPKAAAPTPPESDVE